MSSRVLDFCFDLNKRMQPALKNTANTCFRFFKNNDRNNYRRIRRKRGLPMLLTSKLTPHTGSPTQIVDQIIELLEVMLELIVSSLHEVNKNLLFWQSRSEGTNTGKLKFMILERGPLEFFKAIMQLVHGLFTRGFHIQHVAAAASAQISENLLSLTQLQKHLSTLLAKIYTEIDAGEGGVFKEQNQEAIFLMLATIQCAIHEQINKILETDVSVHHTSQSSFMFRFVMVPDKLKRESMWTDSEKREVINSISSNIRELDQCLSMVISKYKRPRRAARSWLRYTGTAIGLTACSAWLVSHSRLMGSSDLDDWIKDGRESAVAFWKDHVETPVLSIRDELFETFRKRHHGVVELEEAQLTADSLHRMLFAFCEQTTGRKLPADVSEQEMMEIMMARYEKELTHPLQSLLGGELARALLIQIQKLKHDIETAMLELNQILRANEINFAILAALPAFFVTILLGAIVRLPFSNSKGADGKGRAARLHRRLLIGELQERIIQYQVSVDQNQAESALGTFGVILYTLDRLYKSTERHAKASGEWKRLQSDIMMLANPRLPTQYKLMLSLRMVSAYECLLPSTRTLF